MRNETNFHPAHRVRPEDVAVLHDAESFILLARTAEICARPLGFFHADHTAAIADGLDVETLHTLSGHPSFARPLNAAVAKELNISALQINAATLADLTRNKDTRNAFRLVTAPFEQLEAFLRHATGVRLQGAILACVLKVERQRAQSVLGTDAYNTATREAPMLYATIAADVAQFDLNAELENEHTAGAAMTHSYLSEVHPALAQLFEWRLPKTLLQCEMQLTDQQRKAFARLLAAKGPAK